MLFDFSSYAAVEREVDFIAIGAGTVNLLVSMLLVQWIDCL